jgi:ABC-2 type transport system permease protein
MRLSLQPRLVIIALVQPILYLALFGPLLTGPAQREHERCGHRGAYKFFVPGLRSSSALRPAFVGFAIISTGGPGSSSGSA